MAGFDPRTWPSFQQSMPILQGFNQAQDIQSRELQNQQRRTQNQYEPSLYDSRLAMLNAQISGQNIQNQQSPRLLAVREKMADIALRNAATSEGMLEMQNKKLGSFQTNAQTKKAEAMRRWLQSPEGREAWASDPNLATKTANDFANFSMSGISNPYDSNVQSPQQQKPVDILNQNSNNSVDDQSMFTPEQFQQLMQSRQPQSLNDQQFSDPYSLSPDTIANMQDIAASKNIKDTQLPKVRLMQTYGKVLNQYGDKISEMMPSISKYAGAQGKAKLLADRLAAAGSKNREDYEKYNEFETFYVPEMANDMLAFYGLNHTDEQTKRMEHLIDPKQFSTNPELYMKRWNTLMDNVKRSEEIFRESPAQIAGTSRLPEKKKILSEAISGSAESSSDNQNVSRGTINKNKSIILLDPNGKKHWVPEDQADDAIKNYGWSKG